jgi:hypothetical protein
MIINTIVVGATCIFELLLKLHKEAKNQEREA